MGTPKYGVVKSISGSTVTLVSTDYAMTVSPDSNTNAISYGYPVSFPASFNFTMSWGGFSYAPVTAIAKWTINDGFCELTFIAFATGTSTATTLTCVAPTAMTAGAINYCAGRGQRLGVIATPSRRYGRVARTSPSPPHLVGGAWTANTGTKSIEGFHVRYLI